jgi:hypothetical protein
MPRALLARSFLRVVVVGVVGVGGCDSAVDFDADVAGKVFGRAGGALGSVFQVTVDFQTDGVVTMLASETNNDVVVKEANARCDVGAPQQDFFETRVPGTGCVFESTIEDEELPETPETLVIGLRNYDAEEKTVELDPSLDEDLPSPFSFIDSYNTLDEVPVVVE